MRVKIKKLHEDSMLPTQGSDKAAGLDLYAYLNDAYTIANRRITIKPHQTVMVGTGVCIAPPEGYFGAIAARSGLATKQGLRPANCLGICDEDYRGEYIVALYNDSDQPRTVVHGDRIAQLVFLPYITAELDVVDELDITERGAGGFGSTGV